MFKKRLFKFTSAVLLIFVSTVVFTGESVVLGAGIRTILEPVNVTDVSGKFYVENQPTPNDTPHMVVRWQDDTSHSGNAISGGVTYDAGAYTGFTVPEPKQNWQRGEFDDSVNGSPCFQLNGTSGGMLMNSWFTTYQQIQGGGQNTVYEYKFSNPASPWSTSTSKLWLQSNLKLPWFANWNNNNNSDAPVGQLSLYAYLKDISVNKVIAVIVNAFDNRPTTPQEQVMDDTYTYFASTRFGGTRYVTPNQYSGSWRSTQWTASTFYRAEITRQNLLNIVNDINSRFNAGLSTNTSNYVITSAGILQETFRENGDQVSMGSSFSNFGIYESY